MGLFRGLAALNIPSALFISSLKPPVQGVPVSCPEICRPGKYLSMHQIEHQT
jgi:hypothetical protein